MGTEEYEVVQNKPCVGRILRTRGRKKKLAATQWFCLSTERGRYDVTFQRQEVALHVANSPFKLNVRCLLMLLLL